MWSLATNEKFTAVLIAIWVVYLANFIGDHLVPIPEPMHASSSHGGSDAVARTSEPAEPEEPAKPFPVLLAEATPEDGAKVAKKCVSCHTFEAGGKNKIGPNLHDIVGRNKASKDGFDYSGAFSGLGGTWTYEDLDAFLKKPKDFVKGTKMTFAGLRKATDRAEIIQYLRSVTESPPPLPQ